MARMQLPTILSFIGAVAHLFVQTHAAFTPTFSTSSQCGAFTVSWASNSTAKAGPPFSLLLIPVNDANSPAVNTPGRGGESLSQPVYLKTLPDIAWNAGTNTGKYTIDQLPLRTGEKFVVVMDDGFGLGTGGVSFIQTVGGDPSSPTSCLGNVQHTDVLFQLSTYTPPQCGTMTIISGQASAIRGFVPGGNAVSLELPASSTGNMTTQWTVNVPSATSFVLVYIGTDGKAASSGLMIGSADSAFGADCLIATGPHSTATDTSIASSTSSPTSGGSGSPGGGVSTAALVGGILGALAFLAITALLIFFCIYRRTDAMGRPKSRSDQSASRGGRSTVEPYKSHDLAGSVDAGAGGSGGSGGAGRYGRLGSGNAGRRAGGSPVPGAATTANGGATLESRFGGGLFGRKKRGDGANAPKNNTFTSSQRRVMYPGLSIASTQNQSIGTVATVHAPGVGEDGLRELERDQEPVPTRPPGESAVMTRYRDAKRREAREHARDGSETSLGSTTISTPVVHEDRIAAPVRHARDLSAIEEGTGYGTGTTATDPSRRYSLVHSDSYHDSTSSAAMPLNDLSGNEKSSSSNPSSTRQGGRRPSTAPGAGTGAPFHLPTSARDGLTTTAPSGGTISPPTQVHEYPPDQKTVTDVWDSTDALDWRATSDASKTGAGQGGHHPYATAQSPHSETERYPSSLTHSGTATATPSISSRGGGGGGARAGAGGGGGGRGSRRVPHPYSDPSIHSPTEIIRHTDAGPMMDSEDEDEDDAGDGRRRVVELPPSYGEVASSNRGRRRGGGG